MTARSTPVHIRRPAPGRRLATTVCGMVLTLSACGTQDGPPLEEDAPLEEPGPEVDGGAVGPDARVNDDVSLLQVQLAYPVDGVYDVGEDARLFMAVSNTGRNSVSLTDVSGPDFDGVRVETEGDQGLPLTVDPEDNLYVGAEGQPVVTLLDLGQELRSSQSIPVTFTFAEAGEVTIDVMVSAEEDPTTPFDFPDDDPDQAPTEERSGGSAPSN